MAETASGDGEPAHEAGSKAPDAPGEDERSCHLRPRFVRKPVTYEPTARALRLPDVALAQRRGSEKSTDVDHVDFESGPILLVVERAEDIAAEATLETRVDVDVEGLLLSGLRVRSFGADGRRIDERDIRAGDRRLTRVTSLVERILGDAVNRWRRSPVQHFHFENVILDRMRLLDVRTALEDMGFETDGSGAAVALCRSVENSLDASLGQARALVIANRAEGAATLHLWVYLRGDRKTAQRRTALAGGQTYISEVPSGDLEVFVRGQIHGQPRPVLEGIRELHERLRHQFKVSTDRR